VALGAPLLIEVIVGELCADGGAVRRLFVTHAGLLRGAGNDVEGLAETFKFVIARSSCDEAIQ
jgi:hypothetical protein